MTSDSRREAFVWIWLPNETEPVVAGRLESDNGLLSFNYGRSYLERQLSGNWQQAIAARKQLEGNFSAITRIPTNLGHDGHRHGSHLPRQR